MKELLIEQKAKAYDEALERMKSWAKGEHPECFTEAQKAAEFVFPELKESDDEQSKKWILEYLYDGLRKSDEQFKSQFKSAIAWLEKQGEQKPTDKVEPKFKVGDWVVYDHRAYQVVELPKEGYINLGLRRNGKIEFAPSPYCRLWTIQDAKPGDVLTYSDSRNNVFVCIFKEYVNERVYDYCTLDNESFWEHGNWNYLASFSYTPSTKELRDTLLKAMTDAGYTFDFEKKELKKIEQSPIDVRTTGYWHVEDVEQKSAWNEEDEKKNEDEAIRSNPIPELPSSAFRLGFKLGWFKSLRPQKQNITNKDFEDTIREIKTRIAQCNGFNRKHREEVFNLLDSLRPQNTWKPSE